nr:uncharacterized protein LOC112940259 [Solanum lycopersicum]
MPTLTKSDNAAGGNSTNNVVTIDQHHPLFLQSCDTPGSSLISIKLTGPENYALWSSSMRISLLGKSKLGFVTGKCPIEKFEATLHDLWEKCNAVVLSWIMNSVSTELLSGIVYATSAYKVWSDLQERFDKVNGSRIFYLHKQLATLSQGVSSVSSYFSKMRELWAEFDALMPCPSCSCTESKKYMEHFDYQRLVQFLMGLNDSYSQSSNQIMMMTPIPSINKAYAMILSEESRRSLTSSPSDENSEGMALFSSTHTGRNGSNYPGGGRGGPGSSPSHYSSGTYNNRSRRGDVICDFCHIRGHTRNACYKLNGYPADYKPKKRFGAENQSTRDTSGSGGDKSSKELQNCNKVESLARIQMI